MPEYKSDAEILAIVKKFENAEFQRAEWRHADHLIVGLYYVSTDGYEIAAVKMREGIFKLLKAFNIDLSAEMPYHETLTIFWLRTILDFVETNQEFSLFEKANKLVTEFDKNYPLDFYSRERLFSDEARKTYVASDLR